MPWQDMGQPDEQGKDVRPEQQGRMYAATAKEVVEDVATIASTLISHSASVIALFDSGSTQTSIAKTFFDWIGVFVENFIYDLVVSTFARAILTTGLCVGLISMIILQVD